MRAFITGVSGFVGAHLTRRLFSIGWDVFGFDLRPTQTLDHFQTGEITDRLALRRALAEAKPDVVYHLAGLLKSPKPEALYNINLLGTVALFEEIMEGNSRPTVVIASSSAVYGHKSGDKPISERADLHPITHYAVSKVVQEMAALRYYNAYHLPVMILRMFNLLGPGQPPDLACSSFARQIALAEMSGSTLISTGNLDAHRDFVDVRDAVNAFTMVAEKGKAGQIYNVCSGNSVEIRKCLDEMISMSSRPLQVRMEAHRIQKSDVPIQIGNSQKLMEATGWYSQISLKQSLSDLLNDWRERIKLENGAI
jgi:GDP-4-dehydro-6-deoxy-D-mannose reductase